jgi:hypothetical protein
VELLEGADDALAAPGFAGLPERFDRPVAARPSDVSLVLGELGQGAAVVRGRRGRSEANQRERQNRRGAKHPIHHSVPLLCGQRGNLHSPRVSLPCDPTRPERRSAPPSSVGVNPRRDFTGCD